MKEYYVYILSNKNRTVLYIGYRNNVKRRMTQYQKGNGSSFTKKYNVVDLMHLEIYQKQKREKNN